MCNRCGEICIHCRARGIVAIKREDKRKQDDTPPCDESGGARSDSLAEDLGRIMEEDHFVGG